MFLPLISLFGGCGPPASPGPVAADGGDTGGGSDPRFDELRAFVEEEFEREGVVGGSVAIVTGGHVAWSAGFGLRHMDEPDPVTADTLFNLASTSKQFTAATVMSLVDDGVLDLDTPIGEYVPYFGVADGWDRDEVTLGRLLSHSAAYPNSFVGSVDTSSYALDAFFANNPGQPLLTTPGEVWNYSNLGFSLASLVVQEAAGATGATFPEIVRERVLRPAGMGTATLTPWRVLGTDVAYGHCSYYCDELEVLAPGAYDSEIYAGQGGVWASANELGRWGEILLNGDESVLTEASRRDMLTPRIETGGLPGTGYGLGLLVSEAYGPRIVSHGGDNYGFRAQFVLVPQEAFGVVVLVNSDGYAPGTIAAYAASLFTSYAEPDWDAFTPTPESLQDLAGTYTDPNWWGTFEVRYEDGELRGTFVETGVEGVITPAAGNGLYVWDGEASVYATVWYDDAGVPERLVTRSGVAVRAG